MKSVWPILGFLLPTVWLPTPTFAQELGERDWMWGWGGMMAGGGLVMVLFWGGIVLLIVLLVRGVGGLGPNASPGQPQRTAIDMLKERYARGEIEKDEFEERRRTLGE